ncbi:hypothetical protein BDZ97DRAFT_1925371 [Flammula alnicola]|nr:hypothetical protein BDZ97DRAFT_1925371 [Flammula alnicola]
MAANFSSGVPQLPNPLTPMAFIPPDIAFQLTMTTYVLVGTMGALTWETVNALLADYILLTRYRLTFITVIYVISRISTFIFIVTLVYIYSAPVGFGMCHKLRLFPTVCLPLVFATTSLLFYFRVRAMYKDNKLVVGFFSVMWLGVVAGSFVPALTAMDFANLGPTKYCIPNGSLGPGVSANLWIFLANDLLIFSAITWRLVKNSMADMTVGNTFRAMFFGQYLPSFSRALLQDGQAYFLSTIIIHIITGITFFNHSIPQPYRGVLPIPNVLVINIMAGRIYRNTKLGIFRELNATSSNKANLSNNPQTHITTLAFRVDLTRGGESEINTNISNHPQTQDNTSRVIDNKYSEKEPSPGSEENV